MLLIRECDCPLDFTHKSSEGIEELQEALEEAFLL